jgi:hypothetical protein
MEAREQLRADYIGDWVASVLTAYGTSEVASVVVSDTGSTARVLVATDIGLIDCAYGAAQRKTRLWAWAALGEVVVETDSVPSEGTWATTMSLTLENPAVRVPVDGLAGDYAVSRHAKAVNDFIPVVLGRAHRERGSL